MQTIEIKGVAVNIPALDAQLRAQLGAHITGISIARGSVIVHLSDMATNEDLVTVQTLVQEHNPSQLTAVQIRQKATNQALQTARAQFTQSLNVADFGGESATIQTLVARISWLENEIRELRGLE